MYFEEHMQTAASVNENVVKTFFHVISVPYRNLAVFSNISKGSSHLVRKQHFSEMFVCNDWKNGGREIVGQW